MLTLQATSEIQPVRGGGKVTHRFEWSFDEALMMAVAANDGYSAMVTNSVADPESKTAATPGWLNL